jgi:hypothetical protein
MPPRAHDPIRLFTAADVPIWYQSVGRAIFLGDVVDPSNRDTMSVGFARYARLGLGGTPAAQRPDQPDPPRPGPFRCDRSGPRSSFENAASGHVNAAACVGHARP